MPFYAPDVAAILDQKTALGASCSTEAMERALFARCCDREGNRHRARLDPRTARVVRDNLLRGFDISGANMTSLPAPSMTACLWLSRETQKAHRL